MSDENLIALGHTLGIAVIFSVVAIKSRFSRKHYIKALEEELLSTQRRVMYMATIIDEHEIELTDFDRIAILES